MFSDELKEQQLLSKNLVRTINHVDKASVALFRTGGNSMYT